MHRDLQRPSLNVFDEVFIPKLFADEAAWVYRVTAMETLFRVDGDTRQYVTYHLVSKKNSCIYFNVAQIWDGTFRWSEGSNHLDEEALDSEPLRVIATRDLVTSALAQAAA
ncbi:MAG: hypothetical protein JO022_05905 [Acidobacteriaceae bacterium]|nr:hypothetical protein [Acidobacteriaceae bacterium]